VGVLSRLRDAMACFCPFYYSRATKLTSHIDLAVT
jgi:Zn-finger protein